MAGTGRWNGIEVIKNITFDHTTNPPFSGEFTLDGQLLIGSATTDPNRVAQAGELISSDSSVSIAYDFPNLDLTVDTSMIPVIPTTFQTDDGSATPAANTLIVTGQSDAAGTTPIDTEGAGNTLTLKVQKAQAIAATDATKVGLAVFDSGDFSVDANGFVSLAGGGAGQTITGDSGGALSPTSGNWNIFGLSGSKSSGSGSTLTIKSPPFSQENGNGTSALNSGEFVTATATRTLPATASLADGDLVIYGCTTSDDLTITANTGQTIRIGSTVSGSGGTAVSNAAGDSVSLRFNAMLAQWHAVSVIGTWTVT